MMKFFCILALCMLNANALFAISENLVGMDGDYVATVELVAVISEDGLSRVGEINLLDKDAVGLMFAEKNAIRMRKIFVFRDGNCKFSNLEHVTYLEEKEKGKFDLVRSKWQEGVLIDITYSNSAVTNGIDVTGEISIAHPLDRKPLLNYPRLNAGEPTGDVGGSAIFSGRFFLLSERSLISAYKFGNKHEGGVQQVVLVTLLIEPLADWKGSVDDIVNRGDVVLEKESRERTRARERAINELNW